MCIIYLDPKLPTHRKTESIGSESSGSVYSESPTVTNKSWERGASSTSLPFPSLIYPSADSAVAAEEPSALPLGAQLLRSREALAAELALAL